MFFFRTPHPTPASRQAFAFGECGRRVPNASAAPCGRSPSTSHSIASPSRVLNATRRLVCAREHSPSHPGVRWFQITACHRDCDHPPLQAPVVSAAGRRPGHHRPGRLTTAFPSCRPLGRATSQTRTARDASSVRSIGVPGRSPRPPLLRLGTSKRTGWRLRTAGHLGRL